MMGAILVAKSTQRNVVLVGLTGAGVKFVRRHIKVPDNQNDTINFNPGPNGEPIKLGVWKHSFPGSHIVVIRERIDRMVNRDQYTQVFTHLEAEYACGCREDMFRWQVRDIVDHFTATHNKVSGLIYTYHCKQK